jgi:hypothetical protein
MINIHLIPTDKRSRLCYDRDDTLLFAPNAGFTIADGKQNIYITSNEEIKDGDWYYLPKENKVAKCLKPLKLSSVTPEWTQKIILTTDQDLIKDGVQAIDDDFLEWFVKNPNCESIEVEDEGCQKWINPEELKPTKHKYIWISVYKIIIPQEEPKQETIEEAARIWNESFDEYDEFVKKHNTNIQNSFIAGAQWQQEQDKNKYSKNDLEVAFFEGRENKLSFVEWFLKFKKK